MSLLGQIIQGEASSLQGQQAVLNVIMNRAAVNFGGYGTTLLAQATAPSQFSAYPNNLPIATAQANSLADQADAGTLANIVPDSLNYANPTAPGIGPNSWVWGAQASGQGVNVGGDGNIFWANSKGGSPGYVDPTTDAQGGGAQTAAQFQAEYGTDLQPGQGVSMPGQNFNQPNLALDNVAAAGYAPGDTGGMGQYSQSLQTPSDSTYTPGSAPTGGPQGVGVNGTAYDANGNYVGYVSSADTYVPNNASTPAAPSAPSAQASVGGFTTPSQDMGPYDTAQNQAAGLDLNIPGAGANPNAFDTIAPAGSTPGDTGGMAQASQAAGGDYPSGVAGGLGPAYYGGGSSAPDTSGGSSSAPDTSGGSSSAPDTSGTNQAPASGDILGFNDPSQTYTMPEAVNTPAVEASTAQGGNASGDQTVPQAIDKQASVESTAIASAATAQSKAITSAQTSADKSASSLAQQAIKSAQSIASGQQASSKEQTASNQAASQTMLSQVKDLFVRFFLGAGGLVLIAAAVWYFAGRPTPPMPVMRAVRR